MSEQFHGKIDWKTLFVRAQGRFRGALEIMNVEKTLSFLPFSQ
jgi:hypothetical protein